MDHMQNEAMERLRQMYSKSNPPARPRESDSQHDMKSLQSAPTKPNVKETDNNLHQKRDSLLDILMKDKERSLIVLLIVVLLNEKADSSLILALMYLIL